MIAAILQQFNLLASLLAARDAEDIAFVTQMNALIDRLDRLEQAQTDREDRDFARLQSLFFAPRFCSPLAFPPLSKPCSMPPLTLAPQSYPPLASLPVPLLESPIVTISLPPSASTPQPPFSPSTLSMCAPMPFPLCATMVTATDACAVHDSRSPSMSFVPRDHLNAANSSTRDRSNQSSSSSRDSRGKHSQSTSHDDSSSRKRFAFTIPGRARIQITR